MVVNILILLILGALIVLFAWLTYCAVRSSKLWVKIVGGVLGALVTLLLAATTIVIGKGFVDLYRPRPVAPVTVAVEGTLEQLARGEHLATFLCASCHSQNGELPLTGGLNLSEEISLPLGDVYAPNLTPAGKIKALSDADIFRILRTGVAPDGRLTAMGFFTVRYLSDEDAKSIIAFLRHSQPIEGTRPSLNPSPLLLALVGLGFISPAASDATIEPVTAPPKAVTLEYGKYIADVGDCRGCHGPALDGNAPPPAPPGASNLTVVVPGWSRDDFFMAMRTGVDPTGHRISPPMPWKSIGKLDDVELAALFEYLRALTPVLPNK